MDRIYVSLSDFLKNAGIVGLNYLLKQSDAEEDIDYGITDDGQAIWLNREFVKDMDWTDLYFKGFIERYGSIFGYYKVLDKIKVILKKVEEGNNIDCKEDLTFINEKLLSNSYQTGFETIKQKIENPDVYERLKTDKLKESIETDKLCARLLELKEFLEQPFCRETFSMKDIIYNCINRFWEGKSFLNRNYAKKYMKEVFDADFSEPLREYAVLKDKKTKDVCIDCNERITSSERGSIAFMKDSADDLTRKRSAFWNCKEDAYLCPVCAFVYSLVPLGFTLVGDTFVFINKKRNIKELWKANSYNSKLVSDSERIKEKNSSPAAGIINLVLQEKTRELGNIQVITRKKNENSRYTFDIIGKDVLILLNDKMIRKTLDKLSVHSFIKIEKDWWDVYEEVMINFLKYRNQYAVINKLLRMAIEEKSSLKEEKKETNLKPAGEKNDLDLEGKELRDDKKGSKSRKRDLAGIVYDIQLKTNLLRKKADNEEIGGKLMNRYAVREEGYELRGVLLEAKGSGEDTCIRGTIYQLLNALSVGNTGHFMEIMMRIYCSTNRQIPNQFIELLRDRDTFMEYGYAFLLGLQGSHYEKKEDTLND